jgi:N-acetylated-alpha-linked acidic dipeptidase
MHFVRGFNVSTIAALVSVAIAASAAEPRQVEQQFDTLLKVDDYGVWLRELAAEANHVGSPHNKTNAEFILKLFRDWGWQARIETYSVLYPTPRTLALEMIAPVTFTASLKEPPIEGDATSSRTDGLPPYNAYGADGDVTSELVYVNYGMDEDYKELYRHGVDVKGKIVIVRYGNGWRGLKPKLAYEHGAVACLIYSDPKDDGYARGDVYPKGGWRPSESIQRGSVLDTPIYPGDPLTPGVGATKDAKRLAISEAKTILKIPVMPISYADAQPLLAAIEGHVAPESWRGALPITYKMGPGAGKGAPQDRVGLESDAALQRHRPNSGDDRAGQVGHSRQSPRRMGAGGLGSALRHDRDARRSQGNRRAGQERMETHAHDRLRELGRRRARPARLNRVGRGAC